MFIQRVPSRRLICWAILLLFGVSGLTACTKQRASWYLKNAQKRLAAAEQNEAKRFKAPEQKNTSDKVQEAQKGIAEGSYDTALTSAKQASELAKQLLQETKASRANTLRDEAARNVKIATDNQGQQLNEAAYTRINELYSDAEQALAKQKYEKTINLCLQVASEVEALLQPLKQDTEGKLLEAGKLKDQLLREEAEVEAPAFVTDTDKKIAEMRQLVQQDRQYRKAQQVFQDIKSLVDEGITKSLWSRSRKKIAILEKKLVRAINEEAPIYTADLLETSQQQYQDILKNFYPPVQDYRKVLDMANMLDPQLDELILQTRILASTAKINSVISVVRSLDDNKVRTYLPGRLEKMEDMLKTAQEQFKQQQYDECKETCKLALVEGQQINLAFKDFTASEIRVASGKLDEANSVLKEMANIFAMQAPKTSDSVEQNFENSKQALKTVLDSMARDSQLILGTANVQLEENKFSNAIQNARLVVGKSNYVIRETFHTVAHNNVLEVSSKITQVNLNGGAKFAQPEVSKSKDLLEEARGMIRAEESKTIPSGSIRSKADSKSDLGELPGTVGSTAPEKPQSDASSQNAPANNAAEGVNPEAYRPAVSKTAEAKAALEVSIQRVTQGVIDKIAAASKAVDAAEANKAGVYALGDISTSRQVIEQANDLLSKGELFEAANKAEQAREVALDANTKALTAWTQEAMASAEQEIKNAEKAGADHYAAERYKKALNQIASARDKIQGAAASADAEKRVKVLAEGKDLAIAAQQEAVAARMEPVTLANRKIVEARGANAWEEEYPLLMQSIMEARNALEAMESGKYNRARAYAVKASATAELATQRAQSKTYVKRVKSASNELKEATFQQGGLFFNIESMRQMMKRLQDIKKEAGTKEFETISAELDQYEANLYKLMQATPAIFKAVADAQRALYEDLVKRGAKEFANDDLAEGERRIRFAQVDFNQGNFRSSYQNLKAASAVLGSIDLEYKERAFVTSVRSMLAELTGAEKVLDPLMKIPLPMLYRLLDRPDRQQPVKALFMGSDPVRFRQQMDDLYRKSMLVPFPVTLTPQRNQFVAVFDLARQAGMNFEKFIILDQYDKVTARQIVDKSYDFLARSRKQQEVLSAQFEEKGLQGQLADLSWDIGTAR